MTRAVPLQRPGDGSIIVLGCVWTSSDARLRTNSIDPRSRGCTVKLAWGEDRSIELRLVSYQYPDCVPSGSRDWDANWLMVHGVVQDRDQSWEFRDPCMTTWEVEELIRWLDQLVAGDDTAERCLSFLEPNVKFERVPEPFSDVTLNSFSDVTLNVWFALESVPPGWARSIRGSDVA